jgi:enediyne biosynthesis protein E4
MTSDHWTRRRLLRSIPPALAPLLLPHGLRAAPFPPATAPFSRFTDVAAAAGLAQPTWYGGLQDASYILEITGCGCAFIDYDNDGWMDVFMLTGRRLDGIPPNDTNRLYHNNRDGTFTDVTEKAGLQDVGWAMGICVADYDNDGYDDLFVTYYGQNKLYHNNGNGSFTDVTAKAGLLQEGIHYGSGCTFIDRNRNGLLDLFVANYIDLDIEHGPKPSMSVPNCNYEGIPVNCGPMGLPAPRHYFYRNNGDGTFTDISKETGIAALQGSFGLTAVALDVDEDGWTDIFVACDATFSFMLMNNHDGTFREEAILRGVAVNSDGQRMSGMGVGVGDTTLDGHLDLAKTHFYNQSTGLYLNDGKGYFEDVSVKSGLSAERRFICWGDGIVDLDNDGWPDIFMVTGSVYPELEKHFPERFQTLTPRVVFRNRGDGTFAEFIDEAGPGVAARHCSRGTAFGDFDNDGDLDILIMNRNEPPSLLRNDAPPEHRWIKIRLEGSADASAKKDGVARSNRSAIGARVLAHYNGKVQAQALTSQCSYLSVNDPRLHFGIGDAKSADFEIFWPSGVKETYKGLAANQLHTIREGAGIVPGRPFGK